MRSDVKPSDEPPRDPISSEANHNDVNDLYSVIDVCSDVTLLTVYSVVTLYSEVVLYSVVSEVYSVYSVEAAQRLVEVLSVCY